MTTTNIPEAAIEAGTDAIATEWADESDARPYRDLARAVLTAALPHLHPVIETEEQMDALPVGTVVRQSGGGRVVVERTLSGWHAAGAYAPYATHTAAYYLLPATVLHMGGDDD